ncbi:potassium/sodium hyperpolarization-activated cyclic nucleotide-gated channel 2-like isoform X1 [Clavelina lepadiformis]|uniref:potassium/sodium hyperpolarization-activated cyclic nucleotide-gated channel 2-like isoform X1 n=1 Tax=Clavelina lepadiformis TaxID=159417 RepID=UPI0040412736
MSSKRKVGATSTGDDAENVFNNPAIVLVSESSTEAGNCTVDVEECTSTDQINSYLKNGAKDESTVNYLAMNMDPILVRRKSQQIDLIIKAEEEAEIQEALKKERKEIERLVSTRSLVPNDQNSITSALLHPEKSIRGGVTGSMSIPINKMSLKLYGSEKAVIEEQERLKQAGKWIIHPYSNFRLIWDSTTLILLLINIILIPVAISFWKDDETAWLPFKAVSDIWFLTDIIFNFRTGIVMDGPDSDVVLEPAQIRSIYLKSWFAIDFISTFPFDLVFTLIEGASGMAESGLKALSLLRLAKILALLRLLRLSRFIRYMKQWEEIFNFQYEMALAFARIFNLIMLMLFICHFNGCLQYMVPMFLDFPEKTWVRDRNLHLSNVTVWERYSWSVFKSTSHMLCIGYGQFPPHGLVDVWVTYVSMCSGAMCFAMFIGNATSLIQSMDASKRAYKEKYMQVKEYMQFRKLPTNLRHRISDYYENRFQGKMFNEEMILKELNHNLREEIINFNCKELVDQVPFFHEADPNFVNSVLGKLEFEVFLVNEAIVREGSVGSKMYFINRGTVTIRSAKHNIEQSLSDGGYFGEIALLQQNLRRVASVTADTYCYLYSLSVDHFNEVLKEFPRQRTKLAHVAKVRMKDYNVQDSLSSTCSLVALDDPKDKALPVGNPLTEIQEESDDMLEEYNKGEKS